MTKWKYIPVDHDHQSGDDEGGALTNDEHDGYSDYTAIGTPANPDTGHVRLYPKNNSGVVYFYYLRSDGTEVNLASADNLMQLNQTVTPAPDGVTAVFTVSGGSYIADSLMVTVDGVVQTAGVDFNETTPSSGTFTFAPASIPAGGTVIRAFFGLATAGATGTDFLVVQVFT